MARLKEKLHRYVDNMPEWELRLLIAFYESLTGRAAHEG